MFREEQNDFTLKFMAGTDCRSTGGKQGGGRRGGIMAGSTVFRGGDGSHDHDDDKRERAPRACMHTSTVLYTAYCTNQSFQKN